MVSAEASSEKKLKPVKLEGVVAEVGPSHLTVTRKKGGEVRIETEQNYVEQVAVGSSVTLWYVSKDGRNEIHYFQPPLENAFVPLNELRRGIKKVILLPQSEVPDAEGYFDAVSSFIEQQMGWYVAPWLLAREIRSRTKVPDSMLDYINPETGEVDLARLQEAKLGVVRRVAEETRVDAVLELDLIQTKAPTVRDIANWDGASEPIAGKTMRALSLFALIPLEGYVPAATALLRLRDREGRLLWSNRRGFAVLAVKTGIGKNFRHRPIPEVIENNRDGVERWLRMVFDSFLREPDKRASKASN